MRQEAFLGIGEGHCYSALDHLAVAPACHRRALPPRGRVEVLDDLGNARHAAQQRWEAQQGGEEGCTWEQIFARLGSGQSGTRVADICREHGVSDATFYVWKMSTAVWR